MLSVEHVQIAWWKNSEHSTVCTRWATNSRQTDTTTERTRRKSLDNVGTTCYNVGTMNERKEVISNNERLIDGDAMGYLKTSSWFFEKLIAEKRNG